MLRRFIRGEEGAALVEYGLLVGLIAVVCILVITALGLEIFGVFDTTQNTLDNANMGTPGTPS
jgi:pilus assembly protein Flp/PilA